MVACLSMAVVGGRTRIAGAILIVMAEYYLVSAGMVM